MVATVVLNVVLLGVSTWGISQIVNVLASGSSDAQFVSLLAWTFGSLLASSACSSSIGPQWIPILEKVLTSQVDDCMNALEAAESAQRGSGQMVDLGEVVAFSNRQYLSSIVDWLQQRSRGIAGLVLVAVVAPAGAVVCAVAFALYGAFFTNVLANILDSLGSAGSTERRKARYVRGLLLTHQTAGEWRLTGSMSWLKGLFEDFSRMAIVGAAGTRERGMARVGLSSLAAFAAVAMVVASLVTRTWGGELDAGQLTLGLLGLMYAMELGPIGDTGVLVRQAADLNARVQHTVIGAAEEKKARTSAGQSVGDSGQLGLDGADTLLELSDVVCRYPESEGFELRIDSLRVSRGEVVAVVGHNGSGKSTLISLIAGTLEPLAGNVAVATSRVGVVPQVPVRYPTSVAANIDLGAADIDVVAEAAKVNVASKLSADDSEDDVGETGRLSGGQWQRVAVARALGRQSDLLVLDEPSAALDIEGEADLFTTIVKHQAGRGVLVATHHLPNARIATRIIVLEAGRIVEEGTHAELMAMNGRYAEFYRTQAASVGVDL